MNLVVIKNRNVVTSSLVVAESFDKQHGHVLRDIDSLEKDVSNFGEMFYASNDPDSYGRHRRVYYMNRDGFTLLAMGFTGKEALQFKLKYIKAFNEMENSLLELNKPSYQIEDPVERARKWIEEQEEKDGLKYLLEEKNAKLDVVEAKYNTLTHNDKTYSTSEVAKELNLKSAQELNYLLSEMKIQYRVNGTWVLYSKYADKGYTSIKQHILGNGKTAYTRRFTQKGREFILGMF